MAGPSVTYTFVNGNVSDASQVNQNFTDLVNGATDGTKDYNINALTAAGTATLNGNVILGNAASDTIAANGYVSTNLTVKSTDAAATAGPDLIIDRDSASAADADALGRIIFRGNDDAATPADNDYASIEASIVDSGAGSEDGKLDFKVTVAGTSTNFLSLQGGTGVSIDTAVVVNDSGGDKDFRIESDTDTHMFFVDASQNFIGIGESNPERRFSIRANAAADDGLYIKKIANDNSGAQHFVLFSINDGGALSGGISANGANACQFYSTSDMRLKENITSLPSQLNSILILNPCEFDYRDGSGHQIGFIAQEIGAVYPDVMTKDTNGYLGITGWGKTEARLVKAIHELHDIVLNLKTRIEIVESK